MKKMTKMLSILMIVMMLISFATPVLAAGSATDPSTWDDPSSGSTFKTDDITDFSKSLINVISIVGSAAAIITLIVLGIKYMMGSAEEKAEYKKTLLPYIIGAAMVFGASVLTGVIYNIMNPQ